MKDSSNADIVIVFQDVTLQPTVAELPRTQSSPAFRVSSSQLYHLRHLVASILNYTHVRFLYLFSLVFSDQGHMWLCELSIYN